MFSFFQFLVFLLAFHFATGQTELYPRNNYLYGDIWSRRFLNASDLTSPKYASAIFSAVRFASGSGIYLGKFNNQHIFATNKHVVDSADCDFIDRSTVTVHIGVKGKGVECIATFEELDLAFVSFKVSLEDEKKLIGAAKNFAFDIVPEKDSKLFFFGHPAVENPTYELMFSGDDDCRVISNTGDFRLLDEPTNESQGHIVQRWFFATACDMSHGDSGAALFDTISGDAIGLVSTGNTPVNTRYNRSDILSSDLLNDPEVAWKMNLSIPANKMKTIINQQISEGKFEISVRKTLSAILSNQTDKVCF